MHATPTKLRSGAWGAKVSSPNAKRGDLVLITTKSGKSWEARITHVIWRGNGVAICATESSEPLAPRGARRSRGVCRHCGCDDPTCGGSGRGVCRGPSFDPCHDCT